MRHVVGLYALLGALLLTGCGGGGSDSATPPPGPQGPAPLTSFLHVDPGPLGDYPGSVAAFSDHGTVSGGQFHGTHLWSAGTPREQTRTAMAFSDGFVARYNPQGELEWIQQVLGSGGTRVRKVTALDDGSCIVSGTTGGTSMWGSGQPGEVTLTTAKCLFVARYLQDGTLAWVRVVEEGDFEVRDACVFPNGDVGFCGFVQPISGAVPTPIVFGLGEANESTLACPATTLGFTTDWAARWTASGDLVWAISPSACGNACIASGITALAGGDAVLTGSFAATRTFGAGTAAETTLTSSGFDDMVVLRVDTMGTPVWVRHVQGPGRELPRGATTLPDQSVAFTGSFTGDTITYSVGQATTISRTSTSQRNGFVCRYGPNGDVLWETYLASAAAGFLNLTGIESSSDGALVIAGTGPEDVLIDPGGPQEINLPGGSVFEMVIVKYAPSGALDWARRDGGPADPVVRCEGLTVYPNGMIGVAAAFRASFTIDHGGPNELTLPGDEGEDSVLIRYNADGSHDG